MIWRRKTEEILPDPRYTLKVIVEDTQGKEYVLDSAVFFRDIDCYDEKPSISFGRYQCDLKKVLYILDGYDVETSKTLRDIILEDTDIDNRQNNFETIRSGDLLDLRLAENAEDNYHAVEVFHGGDSLGYVPEHVAARLVPLMQMEGMELDATAADVIPLSQLPKNSRTPILAIDVMIKKPQMPEEYKRIQSLNDFLIENVNVSQNEIYNGYEEADLVFKRIRKAENSFRSSIEKRVRSVDELAKITVVLQMYASGKAMEGIAGRDKKLCDLAVALKEAPRAQKKEAREAMLEYIETPNPERAVTFGRGVQDFRYIYDGNPSSLANTLASGESVSSENCFYTSVVDVKDKTYTEYVEVELPDF